MDGCSTDGFKIYIVTGGTGFLKTLLSGNHPSLCSG